MSKPEDISKEIWDEAYEVFSLKNITPETIARAILAAEQRERDRIVAMFKEMQEATESLSYYGVLSEAIAAIRNRGTEND